MSVIKNLSFHQWNSNSVATSYTSSPADWGPKSFVSESFASKSESAAFESWSPAGWYNWTWVLHHCAVCNQWRQSHVVTGQGVSWFPMLEVGVMVLSVTPKNVWVMCCWCFCQALRSTLSNLKLTKMQDFDQNITAGATPGNPLPHPSPVSVHAFWSPNIFDAPPPLSVTVKRVAYAKLIALFCSRFPLWRRVACVCHCHRIRFGFLSYNTLQVCSTSDVLL